jgi:hypothetical protein
MAKKKTEIPKYGTIMLKGIQYYRTRIMDADGKQVSLYAATCEELYEKQLEARRQVEEIIFHRQHPTVAEYCEKWLLMQSAKVSAATLKGYTADMKNYIIKPLGEMYMEEVTADDIRLALVPLSKKSEGLYSKVNMLLKCVFLLGRAQPNTSKQPLCGHIGQGWQGREKERGIDRLAGRGAFGYGQRTSSPLVYCAWIVFRSAPGRNPCIAMGLCISGRTYSLHICKASMAHRT